MTPSTTLPQPARRSGRVRARAADLVRQLIRDSGMSPGERLPSERDLAERFGISRMTVRKALQTLVAEGTLERRGTAGTFLPEPAVVRPLSRQVSTAISEVVGRRGRQPGARLLFFEQVAADTHVARRLCLPEGAPVIVIKRLRLSDGLPFCVETSHLPQQRVAGLTAADVVDAPSLYALLRERFGLTFAASDFQIAAAPPPEAEAGFLGLAPGAVALTMRSTVHDREGVPAEYVLSWNHPGRVTFESLGEAGGRPKRVYTDWGRLDG